MLFIALVALLIYVVGWARGWNQGYEERKAYETFVRDYRAWCEQGEDCGYVIYFDDLGDDDDFEDWLDLGKPS